MVSRIAGLPRWMPWLMAALFFALYAIATAPSIVEFFDDTLEFQLVAPTFGIAHPTGYPFYTLLAGLWSRFLFPVGEWAWRVNLLSALLGGAAVGCVTSLAQKLVAPERAETDWPAGAASPAWSGAAAALLFGVGPTWQKQTTVAEVYALHNLLVAAILLAIISLPANDEPASDPLFSHRMTLTCLLSGLALAHHRTVVLLLPGMLVYLAWDARRLWRLRRKWPLWLAALLAPLLLYLYIPVRAAMGVRDLNGSYINTWSGFWDHALARRYAAFFSDNPLAVQREWRDWGMIAVQEVGWLGVGLAVIGVGVGLANSGLMRRRWLLIVLVAAVNLLFAYFYRVGDVEVFLLPVWMCVALGAGGGVAALGAVLRSQPLAAIIVQATLTVALVALPLGRQPLMDRSDDWTAHDLAVAMTSSAFPGHSQVIALEGEATAFRYMQEALGRAPGVEAITANDEAQRRALLDQAVSANRPVYLTRELPGVETAYSFSSEGALVRVWPRGQSQPGAPQHPLDETLAEGALHLKGYDLRLVPETETPLAELALYWQPRHALSQTLKLSLRLVDDGGNLLTTPSGATFVQDLFPLRMVAPTTTWLPGETVRDVHFFSMPPDPSEAYLLVIVYDAETLAEVGRWQTALARVEEK